MKKYSKEERMLALIAAYNRGKMPINAELIPPDYQTFDCKDELYLTVFMMNPTPTIMVEMIINQKMVSDLLAEGFESIANAKKLHNDTLIMMPITLDMLDDNYVGLIISSVKITI